MTYSNSDMNVRKRGHHIIRPWTKHIYIKADHEGSSIIITSVPENCAFTQMAYSPPLEPTTPNSPRRHRHNPVLRGQTTARPESGARFPCYAAPRAVHATYCSTPVPSAFSNTKYGKGRKGEVCSSPCANEHPAIELRRNRRLVLLDVARDLVRFVFPALLGDRLDALELERVRVDPFLQAFDLVDGEPVVSDEEVAHGDVQVTLALAVPEGHTGKSAAR